MKEYNFLLRGRISPVLHLILNYLEKISFLNMFYFFFSYSIVPYSVHPAFDKGCHYFGVKIKHVPVDKKTGRADTRVWYFKSVHVEKHTFETFHLSFLSH